MNTALCHQAVSVINSSAKSRRQINAHDVVARWLAPLLVSTVLTACSGAGGSSDDPTPVATAAEQQQNYDSSASADTDNSSAANDAAVTPNEQEDTSDYATDDPHTAPDTSGEHYQRAYDYPDIVTMPLQFITLDDGRQLAFI